MSNDNDWERYAKLNATVGKLLLDGKRTPGEVADVLQEVVSWQTKFDLLTDLGIITVPRGYDHATHLATFLKKYFRNGSNFRSSININEAINNGNFQNPSRVMKPGDKFRVRAFKQIVPGTTTSEERMAFLARQKAVHTGAHGASIVFEQKRSQLSRGYVYASLDEKERLWQGLMLGIDADWEDGSFGFLWHNFEVVWEEKYAFLCFNEVK